MYQGGHVYYNHHRGRWRGQQNRRQPHNRHIAKRVDAIITPVDAASGSDKHTPMPAMMSSRTYADAAKGDVQLNSSAVAFAPVKQEKMNYKKNSGSNCKRWNQGTSKEWFGLNRIDQREENACVG